MVCWIYKPLQCIIIYCCKTPLMYIMLQIQILSFRFLNCRSVFYSFVIFYMELWFYNNFPMNDWMNEICIFIYWFCRSYGDWHFVTAADQCGGDEGLDWHLDVMWPGQLEGGSGRRHDLRPAGRVLRLLWSVHPGDPGSKTAFMLYFFRGKDGAGHFFLPKGSRFDPQCPQTTCRPLPSARHLISTCP